MHREAKLQALETEVIHRTPGPMTATRAAVLALAVETTIKRGGTAHVASDRDDR